MARKNSSTSAPPAPTRPQAPTGYGFYKVEPDYLPWNFVEDALVKSHNYWICSTRRDGRPHAMPVWAVWVDGLLYFATDRGSQKGRNLIENPAVVVHLESGADVVIIEGLAEEINKRQMATADPEYLRKYKMKVTEPPGEPLFIRVRPEKVLAWREKDFVKSATRWKLG